MSIAVAVSGGVDSLYALTSLHKQGLEVLALHARFKPVEPENDPVPGLEQVCTKLGIPLHVVDLIEPFRTTVIKAFALAYARGETPNPCAHCNATMKFGALMDAAFALGAHQLATGHYAAMTQHPRYGFALGRAADKTKDQSYFLALVPVERLQKALFPLAELSKDSIRAHVTAQGLPVPLPKESQEICFVPHDDYRAFLQAHLTPLTGRSLPGPGPILYKNEANAHENRIIGHHEGLWQYTEGQRRGLGIAWSEPLYVTGKDPYANALLTGPRTALSCETCTAQGINLLVSYTLWPNRLWVRTRYRQRPTPADVTFDNDRLHIRFHTPQTLSAPGQIVAVFDEHGHVLAGGRLLTPKADTPVALSPEAEGKG